MFRLDRHSEKSETLEDRVTKLEIKIRSMETPSKFNSGDTVKYICNGTLKTTKIRFKFFDKTCWKYALMDKQPMDFSTINEQDLISGD